MPRSQASPNRVAIADPRRFTAEAIAALISTLPGFEVTGVATTEHGLRALGSQKPVVVIVGTPAARGEVFSMVRVLRAELPEVEIVLLADVLEPDLLMFVLDQRLSGLLLTDLPASDVAMCLEQVAHGSAVLPSGWQNVLAARRKDPLGGLSTRQMQVLELLAEGFSYEEIAGKLFISVNTVKFHVRSIFSHLGVRNRLAAARLLAERPDPPLRETATSTG